MFLRLVLVWSFALLKDFSLVTSSSTTVSHLEILKMVKCYLWREIPMNHSTSN